MTIEQIQAAIDAKADARQIINMIADYIQENPGGGGGSFTVNSGLRMFDLTTARLGGGGVFGTDNPLLDDTIINTNNNSFYIYNGNKQKFEVNPTGGSYRFGDVTLEGNGMQISIQDDQQFVEIGRVLGTGGNNTQIRINEDTQLITLTAGNGVNIPASVFADNAAAVTGGLAVGTIYRTGDVLKIVHA